MNKLSSLLEVIERKNRKIRDMQEKIEAHELLLDGYTQYCIDQGLMPEYGELVKAAEKLRGGE